MKKDVPKVIGELCQFLGYNLSPEKISTLAKHVVSIENMRNLDTELSPPEHKDMMKKHFRKGQVGDWKNYFDGEGLNEWNMDGNHQI